MTRKRLAECLEQRVLVRMHSWESTLCEVRVVEASGSGCVKLIYPNGHQSWLDRHDAERVQVVDVLVPAQGGER